jgi:hypothetical protein
MSTNDEIIKERLKVVREELSLSDIIDSLEDDQFKKVENYILEILTETQIDELYFDVI